MNGRASRPQTRFPLLLVVHRGRADFLPLGILPTSRGCTRLAIGRDHNAGAHRHLAVLLVGYEAAGDSVKVTVDGVDGDGKPAHNEWTGKFDGKDYSVTGDPNADMRS